MDPLEPMEVVPVTLRNEHVTLEPLALKHATDIGEALDDGVFRYMPMRSSVRTPSEVRRYIEFQTSRASTVAFAVIDNTTGRCIGSTSYMSIRPDHRGLEIGSTWISKASRGTRINPSMKLLMLEHAFEALDAIRVELRTDARNTRSRAAIEKLGAVFEGILRAHIIMPDRHLRNTACYSITHDEWSDVRKTLQNRVLSE